MLRVWQIDWTRGFDSAWVSVGPAGLTGSGLIAAQRDEPYTVRYRLECDAGLVTRRLQIESTSDSAVRRLELTHTDDGWQIDGVPRPELMAALDCDLEACPLTNTMPIVRHELHRKRGEVNLTMAYVRLPSLEIGLSEQTYTHVRVLAGGGAVVRYSSGDFQSDLTVDADGFVLEYPKLGARALAAR